MPRVGLNRGAVVAASIDLVDEGGYTGFADLTLAALAARAGIAVPSLYKHVTSLADLRREIAIVSVNRLTEVISAASTGLAGRDALRAMAHAIRIFAQQNPGLYAATQVAARRDEPLDQPLSVAATRTLDVMAAVLRGFALPPELTIDAIRVIRSALHGFILLELGGGFGLPDDLDRSFDLLVELVTAGVEKISAESLATIT
ncbi:TetR-like C-terminal domain-containing protein [Glaciihabitans sp. UYNi722]|uniref:TetR/AcrR family transcriptional regulator n=1 Tax=Glaciihabitans sp. UYNi722 TaxID=3156344 RepID=UPI0033935D8B